MLDEIREKLIGSNLTPQDLRIVLDILDEAKKGEQQFREKFHKWLAKAVFEDEFEETPGAYIEVICRYLVKLGYLKLEDDKYKPIE